MVTPDVASAVFYGAGAFLSAFAALATIARRSAERQENLVQSEAPDTAAVFLFTEDRVLDANFQARRMLESIQSTGHELGKLRLFLTRMTVRADALMAASATLGDLTLQSCDRQSQIRREISGNAVRLSISRIDSGHPGPTDVHRLQAMEEELETLRANTRAAPFLLWRQNADGDVTWVNQAYLSTAEVQVGCDSTQDWPLPRLFPELQGTKSRGQNDLRRISLKSDEGEDSAWYDCHITTVGQDSLFTAFRADDVVKSETRRREFTQTLTKSFADLSIGLAIFDRTRRLVLFNPALLDLTNLPTDFLSARPSLVAFLDRLRENRVMPEPRDYRSWRKSIAELEAAATNGTFSDTWSLPDGQTYRITGRPHPDGAVALLFEDISAEMSLTRRFRAEIEQSQFVLDTLDDAVALFSGTGHLVLSNLAYRRFWQAEQGNPLAATTVAEATRIWHELTRPTPTWGDFRDFATRTQDREEWGATVSLRDGRSVLCRFVPQKAGATMVVFRARAATVAPAEELRKVV